MLQVFLTSFAVLCILFVLYRKMVKRKKVKRQTASVMIIAGSGGHTSEILYIVKALGQKYTPRIYLVAKTDVMSENKIHDMERELREKSLDIQYCVLRIPRSREVHQSWLSTVVSTSYAIAFSIPIVFQRKPDIILCNGPGTCVPICLIAFVLRLLGCVNTKIFYVESICRVDDISLSGKILYRFVDHFIVQWEELCEKYKNAEYLGRLS